MSERQVPTIHLERIIAMSLEELEKEAEFCEGFNLPDDDADTWEAAIQEELQERIANEVFTASPTDPKFWILDVPTGVSTANSNRIHEASEAIGFPVVGIVDEEGGGVIAYAHHEVAGGLVRRLNGNG